MMGFTIHEIIYYCFLAVVLMVTLSIKPSEPKQTTTKKCSECGSESLVLLSSQNKKLCAECGNEMDWNLDEGQKALL